MAVGAGVAEDGGDLGADEVEQDLACARPGVRPGEPVRASGVAGGAGGARPACGRGSRSRGGRSPAWLGRRRAVVRSGPGRGAGGRWRGRRRAGQGRRRWAGGRCRCGAMPGAVGRVRCAGHGAVLGPQSPGQGGGGQARGVAPVRRGRRGRRWRRRSCPGRGCRAAGGGGEQDERGQGRGAAVSSCRCQAASTLGRRTGSSWSGVRESMVPSSRTPAAWTTAVSGWSAGMAASRAGQGGAVGDVAGGDRDRRRRRASRSAASSAAPGASGPRRLSQEEVAGAVSATRCRAVQGAEGAGAAGDQHGAVGVGGAAGW